MYGFLKERNRRIMEYDDNQSINMFIQGSPTILVNGKDIYTGEESVGFNYACRIYEFDGEQTGVIPKEFIRAKLNGYKTESPVL
jgi:hypothetical protein